MWFLPLFVLLSMAPVWASLERILGQSIPSLRHSPAVKRNRVYAAVPLAMGLVWWLIVDEFCPGSQDAYCVWYALGTSAALGWMLYVALRAGEGVLSAARWLARHFR